MQVAAYSGGSFRYLIGECEDLEKIVRVSGAQSNSRLFGDSWAREIRGYLEARVVAAIEVRLLTYWHTLFSCWREHPPVSSSIRHYMSLAANRFLGFILSEVSLHVSSFHVSALSRASRDFHLTPDMILQGHRLLAWELRKWTEVKPFYHDYVLLHHLQLTVEICFSVTMASLHVGWNLIHVVKLISRLFYRVSQALSVSVTKKSLPEVEKLKMIYDRVSALREE